MILCSEETIAERRGSLQRLLRPLTGGRDVPVAQRPDRLGRILVIGDRDPAKDVEDIRVPSRCRGLFLSYMERWASVEGGRRFSLERAYLHFFVVDRGRQSDEEILALHCDPIQEGQGDGIIYKCGPHIHVVGMKRFNLHRAHIALCLGRINAICSDYREFCTAFEESVQMINDEFVGRIVASVG